VKWVGLFITLAAMVPITWWLRRNPHGAPKIWILIGFLPFGLEPFHLYIAIIPWTEWTGYVKGLEFSVLDALALALYLSLPSSPRPLPFRVSMVLYFLAALLSTLQAGIPEATLFYVWQLARMFLVYAVVTRACTDPRVAPALLQGMAAGLIMEAGFAIWQRFESGVLQVHGAADSQNSLGMISHLVVFPFFALLLGRQRSWLSATVILAGVTVESLTASRATLGLAAFGYAAVFMLSALRQWTSRKALLLFIGVAAAAIITPLALSSISQRGETTLESSDAERTALITAATSMLSDHPFGVGANQYVLVANLEGYNERSGLAWTSYIALVHNVYLLVAAETGYVGLITFVILLLRPLTVAFRCGFHKRGDPRGDLLLGLGVGLLTVYIHSLFEWVFITFQLQYMFALELGLVAGLAEQLGYWRRTQRHGVRLEVGTPSITSRAKARSLSRGY
jgi:O-antigen ligase